MIMCASEYFVLFIVYAKNSDLSMNASELFVLTKEKWGGGGNGGGGLGGGGLVGGGGFGPAQTEGKQSGGQTCLSQL